MTPIAYPVAERFFAPQGEGLFTGVQMGFIRLVGCSVGKRTCTACDTDFDTMQLDLGGGKYSVQDLVAWAAPVKHVCLTGGEPLDRDVRPLIMALSQIGKEVHLETSGTVRPPWLDPIEPIGLSDGWHVLADEAGNPVDVRLWVTVSPKPGYLEAMVQDVADEVKVILGGLGDGPGWPTVETAVAWAHAGKIVYVQPRNETKVVDMANLRKALAVVAEWPVLRVSPQMHKFLETR